MKNKYLLSLLAALGFSGCSNNNVWDEPCYYGPGPDWTPDVKLTTQVQNEDEDTINGIRVIASYKNQNDSLITDTAYTESREIDNYTVSGIATSTLKFKEYPPKNSEIYLEYTDVDGEKNGVYQQKTIKMQELGQDRKVTLIKEEKKEDNVVSFSDDVFPEKNEMHTVKMPDMVSENTVSEKPQGLDKIDFEKQLEESLKDL